jgi:hypothetical protein
MDKSDQIVFSQTINQNLTWIFRGGSVAPRFHVPSYETSERRGKYSRYDIYLLSVTVSAQRCCHLKIEFFTECGQVDSAWSSTLWSVLKGLSFLSVILSIQDITQQNQMRTTRPEDRHHPIAGIISQGISFMHKRIQEELTFALVSSILLSFLLTISSRSFLSCKILS